MLVPLCMFLLEETFARVVCKKSSMTGIVPPKAPVTPNGDGTVFVQRSKTMSARCGIAAKYVKISNLQVLAFTQRPHSVPTASTRRSHSVFTASMTFSQRASTCCNVFTARSRRAHGARTAFSRRAHSVLTAIIAFRLFILF